MVALVVLSAACAHGQQVTQELGAARDAVQVAEQRDLSAEPRAAEQLRLAKEELKTAEGWLASGDASRAQHMLGRAQSDAELSVALADEAAARAEGQQVAARLRHLREEAP